MNSVIPIGWKLVALNGSKTSNALERRFTFKTFQDAFGFMTRVALEAERVNHHPDWKNVYNQVWIQWNTHDQGNQVSQLDYKMAEFCNQVSEGK
jgi:4a-hydroxytetrahydrobiopterin dehydratase